MEAVVKTIAVALAALLSTASFAQTHSQTKVKSQECQVKYRPDLPVGATPAKSEPLHIKPLADPPSGYACVIFVVDEKGKVVDPKVVETDSPAFGEQLVTIVTQAKWQPGVVNGKPIAHRSVVSASYGTQR
jgi:hypothetical protein